MAAVFLAAQLLNLLVLHLMHRLVWSDELFATFAAPFFGAFIGFLTAAFSDPNKG